MKSFLVSKAKLFFLCDITCDSFFLGISIYQRHKRQRFAISIISSPLWTSSCLRLLLEIKCVKQNDMRYSRKKRWKMKFANARGGAWHGWEWEEFNTVQNFHNLSISINIQQIRMLEWKLIKFHPSRLFLIFFAWWMMNFWCFGCCVCVCGKVKLGHRKVFQLNWWFMLYVKKYREKKKIENAPEKRIKDEEGTANNYKFSRTLKELLFCLWFLAKNEKRRKSRR